MIGLAGTSRAQDAWKGPVEAEKLNSPFSLDDEKIIGKGEKIFGKMCWTCHGENGEGDGVAGENLAPKPSNFTDKEIQSQSDGAFYWKITHGRGNMIAYEDALSDDQRWQLVAFIRSLGAENAK